jgi:hypothetical protein
VRLEELLRAIQYSDESPTSAPSAPRTITSQSSRSPLAAKVDAAFSVVSPGKIGITASAATKKNTRK